MISKKLKDLKNKLTDVSKRNRSISLKRCFKRSHYDLAGLSKIEPKLTEKVLLHLLNQKSMSVLDLQSTKNVEINQLFLLKTIKRDSDFVEKETGNYDIYLGWPFIEGTFKDKTYFRCPLFLIPVRLEIDFEKENFAFKYDETRQPSLNKAFLLAFQKFNETPLKEEMLEDMDELPWKKEGKENDLVKIAEYIISQYKENGIVVDPSGLQKLEKVEDFQPFSREDDEPIVPFRLVPFAVIGQFPQAVSSLLADYDALIKSPPDEGRLTELLDKEQESAIDPNEKEEEKPMTESENYFICQTDLSQENILIENRKGKNLVVMGPPGTGKSQVIANLVADRVARGERVLVVCAKRAALDVVYRRLQKENLASMLALVHNMDADRDVIYEKIRQIAENTQKIRGDTDLDEISQEIDTIQQQLDEYATHLHSKRKYGLSLYDLYTKDKPIKNAAFDASNFSDMTNKELETLLSKSKRAMHLKQKFDNSSNPIRQRLNLADKSSKEIEQFIQKIEKIEDLSKKFKAVPNLGITKEFLGDYKDKNSKFNHLLDRAVFIKRYAQKNKEKWRWLDVFWYWDNDRYADTLAKVLASNNELSKENYRILSGALQDAALSKCDLKSAKSLASFFDSMDALGEALQAIESLNDFLQEGMLGEWKEKLKALDSSPLSELGKLPTSKKIYEEIQVLDTIHKECSASEKEILELAFRTNEKLSTQDYEEIIFSSMYRAWIEKAEKETPIIKSIPKDVYDELSAKLDRLLKQKMSKVPQMILANWSNLITSPMLFNWSEARNGKVEGAMAWLKDDKPDWLDWEKAKLIDSEMDGFTIGDDERRVTIHLNHYSKNTDKALLEVSLSVPVNRENAYHHRNYTYNVSCRLVQRGKQILVHQDSDALAQTLLHEVMKKRRRLTLRGFVNRFKNRGLFDIFPCWLCSPETVSAIMPLQADLFDLVIFDEASQLPLEKAMPSIHRGRSVIVAGDDKQLPPFDLFKIYYSEDEDGEDEEASFVQSESLLHASSSIYPMKPLMWHYRSKYDALIRFSNAAFYNSNLRTMSFNETNVKPIEWIKTNGVWEERSNKTEAKKVVSIIKEMISKPAHPSIGVVTFNTEQQELIVRLLDNEAESDSLFARKYEAEMNRKEGEELQNLFVKNIENVQGDERDIIIFSIAYAPDAKGRFIQHFGTLNKAGGENRLNVAISRAKLKIIIVTSIDPEELKVEGTLNDGPKMLRKYLLYAKAVAEKDTKAADAIIDSFGKPALQSLHEEYDSDFETEVADSLKKMGFIVDTQVGCSSYRIDLALRNTKEENYLLGIECDGLAYHSSPSARERDVYRQRFLENRGWNIFRISSRDWWADREEVLRKIKLKAKSLS